MTRLPLLLAALAGPVWADERDVDLIPPREDDGSIAWIVHDNGTTKRGEYVVTFDVEGWGTITGILTVAPSAEPDTLVILDVPPGLAVVPPGVTTAEGAQSVLRVFEAVGF